MSINKIMQIDGGRDALAGTSLSVCVPMPSEAKCSPQRNSLTSVCLEAEVAGMSVSHGEASDLIDAANACRSSKQIVPIIDDLSVIRQLVVSQFSEAVCEAEFAIATNPYGKQFTSLYAKYRSVVPDRNSAHGIADGFLATIQASDLTRHASGTRAANIVFDRGDGYVLALTDGNIAWHSGSAGVAATTASSAVTEKTLLSMLTDAYLQVTLPRSSYVKYRQYLYEYRTYGDLIENVSINMILAGPAL